MITPKFSVSQSDASVCVTIHAPHVRAQAIEFDVERDQFKFFASPYYLRLTFPGNIVEDDKSTASFDAATGEILVTLSKEIPGENFENLDMLTGLLATRRERGASMAREGSGSKTKRPLIEEIDGHLGAEECAMMLMDEDFDWEIPQFLNTAEEEQDILTSVAKYGFNQQYSGFFAHVRETANEINELSDPETMSAEERHKNRIAFEDEKFDEDYYMENYVNDDGIQPLIRYKSRSSGEKNIDNKESVCASWEDFTEEERTAMLNLPRKTYLITNKQQIYLGLVDILFAYSLDHRINMGEQTVESAWTIGAVSSTLSNLDQFSTLRDVVVACFRRGLAYPLYRNWELCEKALEDVYVLLKLGRRAVLKALLEIKKIFDSHDIYYIYSKIFFDDYCVWLQTASSDTAFRSLAHQTHIMELDKEEVGWPLDDYEDLALQTSEKETTINDSISPTPNSEAPKKPLIQVIDAGEKDQ
ncbi:SHQ1 protein-domain-containing protein [Coemansia spiralis]|nr:SHQ1 protein-domain-containing protein [Coemansia spiralis]